MILWHPEPNDHQPPTLPLREEGNVENRHIEELRIELGELLRKQHEVLESRMLGSASDTELLEYEIRAEIVHEITNQLARAIAG